MITEALEYIPKGGMCVQCENSGSDCSHLKFSEMQTISKGYRDGLVIVRCTEFKREPEITLVHISFPTFYEFEGWKFEYTRTKPFGPWPVKNDLEPRERAGRKFYEMFDRFINLPIEQQKELEI